MSVRTSLAHLTNSHGFREVSEENRDSVCGDKPTRPVHQWQFDYRTYVRYMFYRGFAPMVFCKQCQRKVEDCAHFVLPLPGQARRVRVFDEKVESLAYLEEKRILEIAFKTGQVWQLWEVP